MFKSWILLALVLLLAQLATACMPLNMFTESRCYGTRQDNHIVNERR